MAAPSPEENRIGGVCCAGDFGGPPDDECRTRCIDFRPCADYAGDGAACCTPREHGGYAAPAANFVVQAALA